MVDVFISYKRRLRPFVLRIAQALSDLGLEVWFDASLRPGQTFGADISRAVRGAKCVLVCWSNDAFPHGGDERGWVVGEATIGFDRKVLVPAFIEEASIDPPFNTLHTVDLIGWTDNPKSKSDNWRALLETIGDYVGRPGLAEYDRLASIGNADALAHWAEAFPTDPLALKLSERQTTKPHIAVVIAPEVALEAKRTSYETTCFVSFPSDDDGIEGSDLSWVTQFATAVELLGRRKLQDFALAGIWERPGQSRTKTALKCGAFLALLSPRFLASAHCRHEMLAFHQLHGNSKILAVELEPVDFQGTSLAKISVQRIKFWTNDKNGVDQRLGFPMPHPDRDHDYYSGIWDVAFALSEMVRPNTIG